MQASRHFLPRKAFAPARDSSLDFIRGIAILLVLDCHFGHLLQPLMERIGLPDCEGDAGVCLFFVLSGFLVGGLLLREWQRTGVVSSRRFLLRRAFKIWPQYYVYLLATLLSGHYTARQLAGNLTHLQNYIGGIPHTWTLAVEEHAYLLIALVLAGAAAIKMHWQLLFSLLLAAAVIVAAVRAITISRQVPVFAQTHLRIDSILLGVVLAMLYYFAPRVFQRLRKRASLWAIVLGGGALLLRFTNTEGALRPVEFDLLNVCSLTTMMLIFQGERTKRYLGPVYRVVAWIGLYSYGIYLWHVSVAAPMHAVSIRLHFDRHAGLENSLTVAAGIALGVVTTKCVEVPFLKLRDRLTSKQIGSRLEVGLEEVLVTTGNPNQAAPQVAC